MRLLIPLLLLLPTSLALAEATSPTHCTTTETTIWSCSAKNKVYAVCASPGFGPGKGTLQYRAGPVGKPEFVFPKTPVGPKEVFHFTLLAQGAQLSFTNGGYRYDISEPLKGNTSIWIAKGDGPAKQAVSCRLSSDTLTLTTTINLFKSVGIYDE
jgi:hypothetical protein